MPAASCGELRQAVAASLEAAEAVGAGLVPLALGGVSPPLAAWLLGPVMDQLGRLLWLPLKAVLVLVAGEVSEPFEMRLLLLTLPLAPCSLGVEAGLSSTMLLPTCAGDAGPTGKGEPRPALHSSIRPAALSS